MIERTSDEVLELADAEGVEVVDLRFCDLPGLMQHFSLPRHELTEELFADGAGFDGSSIRGFQAIQESDMILLPDPSTAWIDPFARRRTLVLHCNVHDPVTGDPYSRDPRHIVAKAQRHLLASGIADTCYVGPEAEFFIFDSVHFDSGPQGAHYAVDSVEGPWNTGRPLEPDGSPNRGYKTRRREGYFPLPPMDHHQDLRTEMMLTLEQVGIEVEIQHHEVGAGGQGEIDIRFDDMVRMADKLMVFKYVVKNVAWQAGKSATFMPKPIFGDSGSGMHVHTSLWKGGEPLFFDEAGYAGLSDVARWYIGGLLAHAPSLLAFTNPTTNSYKRLVPGYEAPVHLVHSQRNRSAACRIPVYSKSPRAKRIEFRCPDPSANPYLAFAAILMAGLDGIQNRIEPPDPIDEDLYGLPPEELARIPQVPSSLEEVMRALVDDHEYLLAGDVFTADLIDSWIDHKRRVEIDGLRLRPHPWEFQLYYDI